MVGELTTRDDVNHAAIVIAADIRKFMDRADWFVSMAERYDLTSVAITLETLAGREQ